MKNPFEPMQHDLGPGHGDTPDGKFHPFVDYTFGLEVEFQIGKVDYYKAFAYFFHRFGEMEYGCDPDKELAHYYITTSDDNIIISVGFVGAERVNIRPLTNSDWQYRKMLILDHDIKLPLYGTTPEEYHNHWAKAEDAKELLDPCIVTILDLLRPVSIRDTSMNVHGFMSDESVDEWIKNASHTKRWS